MPPNPVQCPPTRPGSTDYPQRSFERSWLVFADDLVEAVNLRPWEKLDRMKIVPDGYELSEIHAEPAGGLGGYNVTATFKRREEATVK